jgi:hypothetical protein
MNRQAYERTLRAHLAQRRQRMPIVPREHLDPLGECRCQVLGGHLIHWLQEQGPKLLRERAAFANLGGRQRDPLVCYISEMPGLVAAQEILGPNRGPVVWGCPEDFAGLPIADSTLAYHVELRSMFVDVDVKAESKDVVTKHPIGPNETYLVHHDESILGPLFARGGRHLWKWDGDRLSLLEEGWSTWVS